MNVFICKSELAETIKCRTSINIIRNQINDRRLYHKAASEWVYDHLYPSPLVPMVWTLQVTVSSLRSFSNQIKYCVL